MAIGSARANRVKVQPGNAWARRSIFSPASSDGDDASTTSSLSDAMSTASGYSDQIEEATARRATGSATEGTPGAVVFLSHCNSWGAVRGRPLQPRFGFIILIQN